MPMYVELYNLQNLICIFNFSSIASATSVYQLSLFIKINKACSSSLPHFNLLFQITWKLENQMIKPTGIWGDVGEQSLLNPSSRFSAMLHDLPNYIIQSL